MVVVTNLPISTLAKRHYALTLPTAESFLEAARVCLDRHHLSPQLFAIENADKIEEEETVVEWIQADQRVQATWANEGETTEHGAYCCAIAAVELSENLFAVRRAEATTGADYYLAPSGGDIDDLETCFRLEVSGVSSGSVDAIAKRLADKIRQARSGNSDLPAIVAIVGFRERLILIQRIAKE